MNKDRLLSELGDLARQEGEAEKARLDERWDRLAAGMLTAEEETELKALAESSPEAREAYQAFQPLGADFQARMLIAINAERTSPAPQPVLPEPGPRILPFRRAALRRLEVWLGTAAAVAAGLFLVLRGPALPPLPVYNTPELTGGAQDYRGGREASSSRPQIFVPGSPLTLTATPRTAVQGAVEARAFLSSLSGRGDVLPWMPEPRLEVSDQGSVRLQGTLGGEIQLSPGDWRIWIVVGRKGGIPSARQLQTELRAGRLQGTAWQAVATDLRVVARASP
jgi:hypothetical protein